MSSTSHPSHPLHPGSRSPVPSRRIRRETASPTNAEKVPLVEITEEKPPLARAETDEDLNDDRETVSAPYPGVDDGFFNGDADADKPKDEEHPEHENDPKDGDVPIIITTRAGGDGDSEKPDEVDGSTKPEIHPGTFPGRYPYAPSFGGHDIEHGSVIPELDSIPDLNVYQHKKTLAQGMMDLALFSANANQLRYVLESFNRHPYYYPSLVLISFSLIFQVAVGIGLIWNATFNVKDEKHLCTANKINNFTVIGIFLITVVNVFISAFGVANAPTTGTS